jgi:hypothetical protein
MWSFIGPAALGLGLGLALANAGTIAHERARATDALDALVTERLRHHNTAAALGTCQDRLDLTEQGMRLDHDLPTDLGDFVLPDAWRVPGPTGSPVD